MISEAEPITVTCVQYSRSDYRLGWIVKANGRWYHICAWRVEGTMGCGPMFIVVRECCSEDNAAPGIHGKLVVHTATNGWRWSGPMPTVATTAAAVIRQGLCVKVPGSVLFRLAADECDNEINFRLL